MLDTALFADGLERQVALDSELERGALKMVDVLVIQF